MKVAKIESCPERDKYVCILMDEMHVKADYMISILVGLIENISPISVVLI